MSVLVAFAAQANTFLFVSGRDTEVVVKSSNATSVGTILNVDRKSGWTFSEQTKVSSSETVPKWRHVARLARIAIDENEIVELCTQLDSIMSFVAQLSALDVSKVEPMTSAIAMELKKRPDVVTDGGIPDDIVKNAPVTEDHFFVVPKVVE